MYSALPNIMYGAQLSMLFKALEWLRFSREISADYKNKYFNSGNMKGNFRLSTPKMAFWRIVWGK